MHALRIWLVGLLAVSPTAHADLYRWIDPQSGSVKYSSVPPPWYGDAAREARSPAVELLPYQPQGDAPLPESEANPALAGLEARWRGFLQSFSTLAASNDFERAGRGIEQQLEAYQAVVAELDRQDPGGVARRREYEASVLEKLHKGMEAQLSRGSAVRQ